MEQYQSMAESINKLKHPMIVIGAISALVNIAILGAGMFLNLREDKRAFTTMEACHYGMKSLFENNPKKELFNKAVLKDVKGRVFEIEEIGLVKVIDSHQCDVVAKDAKGHRSYRVKLEKNSSFEHLYRIIDVSGQKIVSDYQWRASL